MCHFGHRFWCPMSSKRAPKATAGGAIGGAAPTPSKRRPEGEGNSAISAASDAPLSERLRSAEKRASTKRLIASESPVGALGCIPEDGAVGASPAPSPHEDEGGGRPGRHAKTRPTTRLRTRRTTRSTAATTW